MCELRVSKETLDALQESDRQFSRGETISAEEAREKFGIDE